ncbi:MAG: DEAD/DEAH box helicase [Acidobacteriota bacterium]
MKPERNALHLLAIASSKAKMWEYRVPLTAHIAITEHPSKLLDLAIGALGDFSAFVNGEPCDANGYQERAEALRFASRFFDTFRASRLAEDLDPYDFLCASASYYLCDMPGSSAVLARQLDPDRFDLGAGGMDRVLLALLRDESTALRVPVSTRFRSAAAALLDGYAAFRRGDVDGEAAVQAADDLRHAIYHSGSARELLFADAAAAVLRKRFDYSVWTCLPRFTELPRERWRRAASKPSFMREFWPAQRLLGEKGILRGVSAVVQMPTSAGKTKATELIIRSALLSGRTSLAVVVAPFRALCHEISGDLTAAFVGENTQVDEVSDVLQRDFDVIALLSRNQVLVVTPEKLHYVLRHHPGLTAHIGLIIYDEGHLFDDGTRGVNYELLLASIKRQLSANAQVLLISAVIGNADDIRKWLVGDNGTSVSGRGLDPTYRSVAFVSWRQQIGRLEFTDAANSGRDSFFVPRVLEQVQLRLRGRESNLRPFPMKDDPSDIALYLGLKLVANGSVAVFCGRKDSVSKICTRIVDCFTRSLQTDWPAKFSDADEVRRLFLLHERNLGRDCELTISAALGVYAHHGNVPHGIRISVEYAMQKALVRIVICTSTLAQGVNLPIRYIIVAGVYQGRDRIKVRDFQNLVGRAGRAGMHTEGTLLFADPLIYDAQRTTGENWRWSAANILLNPDLAEPCLSALAAVLRPIYDDRQEAHLNAPPLYWAEVYLGDPEGFLTLAKRIADGHASFSEDDVRAQLAAKKTALSALQSYLLAHSEDWLTPDAQIVTDGLAEGTLAFSMADDQGKGNIRALFQLLAVNMAGQVHEAPRRAAFGRTLLGLSDCLLVENWVRLHLDQLRECPEPDLLLSVLWSLLIERIPNRTFRSCRPVDILLGMGEGWVTGQPFHLIFQRLGDARIGLGPRPRKCTLLNVIEMCENALGYEGSLLVGAVSEMAGIHAPGEDALSAMLTIFQKRLKYGLPGEREVILYELGFADRPLAQELAGMLVQVASNKRAILAALRTRRTEAEAVLANYPSLFRKKLADV